MLSTSATVAASSYGMDPMDLARVCSTILQSRVEEPHQPLFQLSSEEALQPLFQLNKEEKRNRTRGSGNAMAIGALLLKLRHPYLTETSASEILCEAYEKVTGSKGNFPNTTFRRRTKEYMEGFTDTARNRQKTATYGTLSNQDWPQLKYVLPLMTILSITDLHREDHYRRTQPNSNNEASVQVDHLFQHSLVIIDERMRANHPSAAECQCIRDAQKLDCSLISFIIPDFDALGDNEIGMHEAAGDIPMEMVEDAFPDLGFPSDIEEDQFELHPLPANHPTITDRHPDYSDYTPITMEDFLPPPTPLVVDSGRIVLGPGFDTNRSEFDEAAGDIPMEMVEDAFPDLGFPSDIEEDQFELHPLPANHPTITDRHPDYSDYTPITMEDFLPPPTPLVVDSGRIVLGPGFDTNRSEFDPYLNLDYY